MVLAGLVVGVCQDERDFDRERAVCRFLGFFGGEVADAVLVLDVVGAVLGEAFVGCQRRRIAFDIEDAPGVIEAEHVVVVLDLLIRDVPTAVPLEAVAE